jgi:hypothetical protein
MNEPRSTFDDCISATGAFLSRMVISVRCRHCRQITAVAGSLDQALVLWRHRQHLGDVVVDLLVRELDTGQISIMRLRLLSLEIQMFGLN